MVQCTATRKGGEPCNARALPGRELCWAHDPELKARADEARRKGGHGRANAERFAKRMPRDMKELARRILESFEEVHTGELAPSRAHAMARLAAVYVQLHEVTELEPRISALEERAQQPARRAW